MRQDETLAAYDSFAPLYEEYSKTRSAYLKTIDARVIQLAMGRHRLLDVGCGDGRRIQAILDAAAVPDFELLEPSEGMAAIAKQRLDRPVWCVSAQDVDTLDIGTFDIITALWNVFGHIDNNQARLDVLQKLHKILADDGVLILDVNNRHNAAAYGRFEVFKRVLIDRLMFDEKRGDAEYDWKIGDTIFKAKGHLFAPAEIESLCQKAGFVIDQRTAVNYQNGKASSSVYDGQLLYILKKA